VAFIGITLDTLPPALRHRTSPRPRPNIALAFPQLTEAEQHQQLKAVYDHVGMAVMETAWLWFRGMEHLDSRFSVSGQAHLDQAIAENRGVILLQAHFSTLEIAGGFVGPRWPIAAVYDPPKNALVADWLVAQRRRRIEPMIDNKNIRDMIRHLRKGNTVWYSPDQTVSRSQGGVASHYFNQPVLTSNGTARIVRMTGATVIPMIPTRHDNGQRYHIEFFAPLEIDLNDER